MSEVDTLAGPPEAATSSANPPSARPARSSLRAVALPTEHGGWGLTLEPGVLGLLVAPSLAGTLLALAALVAFLVRTPLKVALVDCRRGRALARTRLARRVAAAELVVLFALVVAATATAAGPFWVPVALAVPLILVEAWFEVRSRGRRLVPELAGASGVCAVAPAIVLADGGPAPLAFGLWLILAARVVTSIPHVRDRIADLHGRGADRATTALADLAALSLGFAAVLVDRRLVAGAVALVAVVAIQRLGTARPTPRAVVLGLRQTAMGFGLVVVTALGVLSTSS